MRLLLAIFLVLPAFAQEQAAKPEAQPEAKTEAKKEEAKAESPVPSAEQWLSGSIDFGYRWLTDIRGSKDAYRSVVNLGEGPKLTGVDLTLTDPKKRAFDRMDIRALGWGGDPYNTAHLDARKQGIYDLRFDYRNIAYFNALPSFANPTAGVLSEHTFDTHRRMTSFDLDLMPGQRIVPFFAYSRDGGRGRGASTFYTEGNEYAVPTTLSDHTDNFRGGLRFEFNRWHVTLEEGHTSYSDDQRLYETQKNLGNRSTLIGTTALSLSQMTQQYGISADGQYSKVQATANPTGWINLFGQFLYSQPKTDVTYSDSASGSFVVLSSLLFYNGEQANAIGTAKAPHTSGNGGVELRPFRRLRIVESISTDRTHNASYGLLTETLLFGSTQRALSPAALNDRLILNTNQQQIDVIFDLTNRITLRGGHRYVWGDATVRAGSLSQAGLFESGEVKRQVGLAGINYRAAQKLSFNLDYEGASSDRAYFRTSLYNYQRVRMRGRYQLFGSLALQSSYSIYTNENPSPGVKYDFESRDFSVSAFWTPSGGKRVSLTGEYSRSALRSDINYLVPQALNAPERSLYRDNAHTATGVLAIALPGYGGMTPKLETGGSLFVSSGSRPTSYYQPLARLSLPIEKHVYWNTEWRWYGFGEQFYAREGFRAHTFFTGVRLVR